MRRDDVGNDGNGRGGRAPADARPFLAALGALALALAPACDGSAQLAPAKSPRAGLRECAEAGDAATSKGAATAPGGQEEDGAVKEAARVSAAGRPQVERWTPAPSEAPRGPPLLAAAADFTRLRTKTVVPAADPRGAACDGALTISRGGACARVSVLAGPFVVTDLYAPGGCGDELFAYVESDAARGWMIFVPATQPLNMHGVQLVVAPEEKLHVGARTDKGPLRSDPFRCSVTLGGWKPRTSDDPWNDCDPPYDVDEKGVKHFKPSCLQWP